MPLNQTEKMVINNPAQNDSIIRYLVVCTVGCLRSPTIQMVLYDECGMRPNVRCAGLDDLALIPVSERLIEWADVCICVERAHADIIANDWEFMGDIYNFSIPDIYEYADPDLMDIIKHRLDTMEEWVY